MEVDARSVGPCPTGPAVVERSDILAPVLADEQGRRRNRGAGTDHTNHRWVLEAS